MNDNVKQSNCQIYKKNVVEYHPYHTASTVGHVNNQSAFITLTPSVSEGLTSPKNTASEISNALYEVR